MVSVTSEQVYNALRDDWEPGRQVQHRLEESLGLTNLGFLEKLGYALTLRYWGVTSVQFYSQIARLQDQGLADLRYFQTKANGYDVKIPEVKKLHSGNSTDQPEFQEDGVADLV